MATGAYVPIIMDMAGLYSHCYGHDQGEYIASITDMGRAEFFHYYRHVQRVFYSHYYGHEIMGIFSPYYGHDLGGIYIYMRYYGHGQ